MLWVDDTNLIPIPRLIQVFFVLFAYLDTIIGIQLWMDLNIIL